MLDDRRDSSRAGDDPARPDHSHGAKAPSAAGTGAPVDPDAASGDPPPDGGGRSGGAEDDSIFEAVGALIEDAGLYAQAEIAFQKTRAALAGRNLGIALGALVLALILLHLALIALAVGGVIALAPLVTIWGAIAIVVGVMLAGVAVLAKIALGRTRRLAAMFADTPAARAADTPGDAGDAG